jgi:hypothetical protein
MDCSKTGIIFHHRAEFKHNLSELQTYRRTDGSLSANVSDIALTAQLEENNEPWVSNMGLSESSAVVFLSPGGLVGSKMASLGPIFCPACQYLHLLHGLGWLRKHLSATKRRPQSINQWPSIRSHPDERSGGKHTPSSVWDAMFPLSTHPPARIHRIDFPDTSTRPSPLMRINGTGAEMCSTRCRAVHTGAIYTEHGLMSSTRAGTGSSVESGSTSAP